MENDEETEYDSEASEYEYDNSSDEDEQSSGNNQLETSNSEVEDEEYDKPIPALSPIQEMGLTAGVMMLCNKLDLTDKKIIMMARFAFIGYIVLSQIFLIYVRFQAKKIDDRTPITISNPLSNLVQSKMGSNDGGTDMVKNIASSFLTTQSTVVEYDLKQAKVMNNSLLIPMVILWLLHFKMNQVQPLFFQTVAGVKDLLTSPLFQIYALGLNLKRPFPGKISNRQEEPEEEGEDSDDTALGSDDTTVKKGGNEENSEKHNAERTEESDEEWESEEYDEDYDSDTF